MNIEWLTKVMASPISNAAKVGAFSLAMSGERTVEASLPELVVLVGRTGNWNASSLRPDFKELEEAGFLIRQSYRGAPNRYTMTFPRHPIVPKPKPLRTRRDSRPVDPAANGVPA